MCLACLQCPVRVDKLLPTCLAGDVDPPETRWSSCWTIASGKGWPIGVTLFGGVSKPSASGCMTRNRNCFQTRNHEMTWTILLALTGWFIIGCGVAIGGHRRLQSR
jgi:hypothetical protein